MPSFFALFTPRRIKPENTNSVIQIVNYAGNPRIPAPEPPPGFVDVTDDFKKMKGLIDELRVIANCLHVAGDDVMGLEVVRGDLRLKITQFKMLYTNLTGENPWE